MAHMHSVPSEEGVGISREFPDLVLSIDRECASGSLTP